MFPHLATWITAASALALGLAPVAPDAAADVSSPASVSVSSQPLGLRASWPAVDGATAYRAWVTGSESDTSVTIPADTRDVFLGLPDTSTARSVSVVAVTGEMESAPTVSARRVASSPGGTVTVASAPRTVVATSLKARRSASVALAGRGGVPRTGVTGVWVTVDAAASKRNTRATSIALSTPGATTSLGLARGARTVRTLHVRPGTLRLRAGRGAVSVRIRAVAWTLSAAASAGRTGTITTIAPTSVLGSAGSLRARRSVWVSARRGGVPSSGVRAAVVTLTATGSSKASTVGLTTSARGSGTPVVTTVPRRTTQATTIVPLDAAGRFRVVSGSASASVRAAVTGWVSSRNAVQADPGTAGEWTTTQAARPVGTVSLRGRATAGIAVAGRAGVPALTSATPPTAVLLTAKASTSASAAAVGAGSTLATLRPLRGRPDQSTWWVPIAPNGTITVRNVGTTSATVGLSVVGWTTGTSLLDPDTRVVTSAGATFGTRDPVSGSLTVPTAARPPVGAVLASGPTATNPQGFLLRVLAGADHGDGTTTLSTRDAALTEAVRRGRASRSAAFVPRATARRAATLLDPHTISFDWQRQVGGGDATATVSGSASLTVDGDLDIDIGWKGIDGRASLTLTEALDASFEAEALASWSETIDDLAEITFATIVFTIGPVPVVVQPGLEVDAWTSGSVSGAATVEAHQSASATIGIDLDDGLITRTDSTDPTVSVTRAEAALHAEVGLHPEAELELYDHGELAVGLPVSLNADWTYPECRVRISGRLGYSLSASLEVMSFEKEVSHAGDLYDKEFERIKLPFTVDGCYGPWHGTVSIQSRWATEYPESAGLTGLRQVASGSYTELEPSDPEPAVEWRRYRADVSLTVTDWSKGNCSPPPDVGGPYYHLDPTSEAKATEAGSSEALGYSNGEVIAFADKPDGTYVWPLPARVTTSHRYLCPGWETESEATSWPLSFDPGGGTGATSDRPLNDTDPSPLRLSGATTWTHDPGGFATSDYEFTITYDLTREEM
ncbi:MULTISPECIES: hypothetical protein [unclassified Aeromicrobium]|uniref:hypothetical protein n=1 Tax=unclassified Aeromicrobium TaxID=2633570 RepID=UPI00396B19E8